MPVIGTAGFQPVTIGAAVEAIRAELDATLSYTPDYVGTIEGAWTLALGQVWATVDAGTAVALGQLSLDTAVGPALDAIGSPLGVTRRAATASRYTVRMTSTGSVVVPAGTVIQGGGDDGAQQWSVAADTTVTTDTQVIVDATTAGPVALAAVGVTTFSVVTPVTGLSAAAYDPTDGDAFTVGRARESDASLRARIRQSLSGADVSTVPGVRSAVLSLTWVVAASVTRTAPGVARVAVAPAPVGPDQTQALVDTIGAALAFGIATDSASGASGTYTYPDGITTDTIYYAVGSTQAVTVATTLALASGVVLADVQAEVEAAIDAVFAALGPGDILRYTAVYCAIADVVGIVGVSTLTLNAGTVDVSPSSSADVLIPGTVTVA